MYARFACLLPVLLALGCKQSNAPQTSEPAARSTTATAQYADAAYAGGIQPLAVCEHLARMVAAEAGVPDPQIDPGMMAECQEELTIEAATRGTANWNDIAGCVLQAVSEADLDACDQRYPMPGGATSWDGADGQQERAVCEHMLEVVMREAVAELGDDVPPLTDRDRRELGDECVESFLSEQRPNLEPRAYDQLLNCIGSAQSGAQMQAC